MAARLLEGKAIAEKIRAALRARVDAWRAAGRPAPRLVAIQIGENTSSAVYVKAQQKAAEAVGVSYELKTLPADAEQGALTNVIAGLNADPSVSAIILQMPVPKTIDAKKLIESIDPAKDAEGMHPFNLGRLMRGESPIGPCTAMAVMELLDATGEKLYGKEAVVVGHSEIVGKPLALLLVSRFATTTVCHIATAERGSLADHVRRAEVLIVAVGKAGVIPGEWVRPGAVVVDVGINRSGDRIVGDVSCDPATTVASCITPVPGGVGPLTTALLMRNTIELYAAQVRS